ncbi:MULTISPECIES: peptide deformylase [Vagococcus]|uniref:Peptide deformylase n=1 Tax=Vagococcus fluvialis bH819 TaxID=1255619 RepID=A0A1X6WLM4_9ENTE|nr:MULTISPECIES: peptide deformylase [Vagococcus]SLM85224.1 Peptide deformylase [Vagococcus fluvialis bH819]HCM88363.1 peptide deformylase [Vagococcus sp.]
MITMNDIIREGHPTLRKVAEEVSFPLSDADRELGEKMTEFLKNSQDPELAEKYQLRGGVGLAAPQLDVSKRMIAIEIPNMEEEDGEPFLSTVMYNPKILSHSVQQAAIEEGEGCLSVDRHVPGLVVRNAKITISYFDQEGEKHKLRLKHYPAIVIQHELDHLNGIMFYDHINKQNPNYAADDVLLIQ